MLSNYHTHTNFCDGTDSIEVFIQEAKEREMDILGFSSHAPVEGYSDYWVMEKESVRKYLKAIQSKKKACGDELVLYAGVESDFIEKAENLYLKRELDFDYVIGGIHLIKDRRTGEFYCFDGSAEFTAKTVDELFKGDVKAFCREYYRLLSKLCLEYNPDIIAHFDVITKNNKDYCLFNEEEDWYLDLVSNALTCVRESGSILEINTGAMSRGYTQKPYPNIWILKECYRMGIPISINSDCHRAKDLTYGFDAALALAKRAGYNGKMELINNKWMFCNFK